MLDTKNIRKVKYGNNMRYTFGKTKEVMELPYLLEIQKDSYYKFLNGGIQEVLDEYSPIVDYSGKCELQLLGYELGEPKHTIEECRRSRLNYTMPLKVNARLVKTETGEVIDQQVFMGDIPCMSEQAYFIVNGVERVVISQIVKSAAVYFSKEYDKSGKILIDASLHSPRGTRLSVNQDHNEVLKVIINASSKVSAGVF